MIDWFLLLIFNEGYYIFCFLRDCAIIYEKIIK